MQELCFPAELWADIFQLSCTDDGYTGRSLSSVSKLFRTLSAPFKYQSIAFDTSLQRMENFPLLLEALLNVPPPFRRIRYLYIGCGPLDDFADSVLIEFERTVSRIFELSADTLQILSIFIAPTLIVLPAHHVPFFLPEIQMPALEELTWIFEGTEFPLSPAKLPGLIQFPALRRLCISANSTLPVHNEPITRLCPNLLFFRSKLHCLQLLGVLLEGTPPHQLLDAPPSHSGLSPHSGPCGTSPTIIRHLHDTSENAFRYLSSLNRFWENGVNTQEFKQRMGHKDLLVVSPHRDLGSTKQDWQDRILGKEGPWKWEEWDFR
ncbi:hypothetical protein BDN72DRAFT_841397 [Pluteus cervinus]|uniref:Uncharacterized protein n=1 Tax=Pluteus cervinus TaxID=181527 RepID=A0ACD3ASU8_9AGAR|nr:hypothetical protein BDN72DRAFT_841397 [Pluteus cervinus]